MTRELAFSTIAQLRSLLDDRKINAVELVEFYAKRIEQLQQHSKAFISTDIDNAMKIAARCDQHLENKSLSGIPYACKDLFDVKGIATTAGSRVLSDNIAECDAVAVSSMNAAGAIFLGKNNLHEFAYGATGVNNLYGTVPNPYDATRLAGGSSSGSAAAVALGLCSAALGTDTGGSVRAPAALCGLVGFKPTYGRISTEGVIPFSWSGDHVGSLTRNVEDAALVFAALDGQDGVLKQSETLNGKTIGIPESFFYDNTDSEILASVEVLMTCLQQAGAHFVKVVMPSMEYTRSVALTIQMPEALSYHNRFLETYGDLYSDDFRAGLAFGQCLLAEHYVRAKRFVESYRRDTAKIFDKVDYLLTPATPTIAPEIGAAEVCIDSHCEAVGNTITRFTSFFNLTGHPAISFPTGMHSKGLPMSAQIVGRHFEDEALLEFCKRVERELALEIPIPDIVN